MGDTMFKAKPCRREVYILYVFNLKSMMIISMILRIFLVLYGEWHDAHMEVRYTDIDYFVFSDAASLVATGSSPFERLTYRYSPLLAMLLVPNSLFHRTWGKFLFSSADLLVGYFIHMILRDRNVPEVLCLYSVASWLFNPFTFTIGTRGNCEPVACAMILWVVITLMKGNLLQAAFWYGLVVHFRIYPIIYSLPIMLVLDTKNIRLGWKPILQPFDGKVSTFPRNYWRMIFNPLFILRSLFTKERVIFGMLSGSIFLLWTVLFFCLYGSSFLDEALFYHLTRVDPRHNFSIYFYHIYLHHQSNFSNFEKLVSFLPQILVQTVLIFSFSQDLLFCIFVQTFAFVAFNKVVTAQYFVWFFCLLPLILPWSKMKFRWQGLLCILAWTMAQLHWLFWAYVLEFKGKNVLTQLWLASIVFLISNTYVLIMIIRSHRFSPLFNPTQLQDSHNKDE